MVVVREGRHPTATPPSPHANTYLHPEYPSQIENGKKCPLAMLVETCSQIGMDPSISNTKRGVGVGSRSAGKRSSSNVSVPPSSDEGTRSPITNPSSGGNRKRPPSSSSSASPPSSSSPLPPSKPTRGVTPKQMRVGLEDHQSPPQPHPHLHPSSTPHLLPPMMYNPAYRGAGGVPCSDPHCSGCLSPQLPSIMEVDKAQLYPQHTCNWIIGGEGYCGKRFPSSEELLHHLKSHTSERNSGGVNSHPYSTSQPPSLYHPLFFPPYSGKGSMAPSYHYQFHPVYYGSGGGGPPPANPFSHFLLPPPPSSSHLGGYLGGLFRPF